MAGLSHGIVVLQSGRSPDDLAATDGDERVALTAAANTGPKPSFPSSELEQTAAVLSVLNAVTEPASPTALAVRFKLGRRVPPQVGAVSAALVWVGRPGHDPRQRPQLPASAPPHNGYTPRDQSQGSVMDKMGLLVISICWFPRCLVWHECSP